MTMNLSGHYEVHLRDYLYVLRKRRGAIIAFFVFSLMAAGAYTAVEKVLYKASATILIERDNPNVVDFKEVMALDASANEYYQTQYSIIKSRTLIAELVEKEKLAEDPYLIALANGGVRGLLRKVLKRYKQLEFYFIKSEPEDIFVRKMLSVEPVRNSRLVEVSVQHPDPVRSAEIVNSLVKLYIKRNLSDRFQLSQQATGLISNQLVELKEKVEQAERNLQKYKEDKALVNIPSMKEKDKFVQDAKLELVKIQSEESKLAKRYLPAHPKRIHIRSQIEGLEEQIKKEETKTLELSRFALEYQELEREAESARQIYKSLLKRMQETTSEAKTQASNIMVVDNAIPSTRPFRPQPIMNFVMAAALGILGGFFTAFFLEYLDATVKLPEDIERGLGLDLLGIVPEEQTKNFAKREIFFDVNQHSAAAESIRALRTALLFKLRTYPACRNLIVTSPNPEEGKSMLALNLALAFQQNNLKVILLDADLRKPRLHKIFEVDPGRGITDVLESHMPVDQAIYRNPLNLGLDFMACGRPSSRPAEILGSLEMKNMVAELKKHYDIIVMDSAPYLPVADTSVLSEFADALIVVAKYQSTERQHLKNLAKRFSGENLKEIGVVINRVSVKIQDYYYQQYYYYGYGDAKSGK